MRALQSGEGAAFPVSLALATRTEPAICSGAHRTSAHHPGLQATCQNSMHMQGDLKGAVANNERVKVAVLGASGYTGAEVIRLGASHPHMEITQLTAERAAGKEFEDVFPSLAPAAAGTMVKIADVDFDQVDAVFCCLPHATTQEARPQGPLPTPTQPPACFTPFHSTTC